MYLVELSRVLDAFTLGLVGAAAVAVVGAVVSWVRSLARLERRLDEIERELLDDRDRRGPRSGSRVEDPNA